MKRSTAPARKPIRESNGKRRAVMLLRNFGTPAFRQFTKMLAVCDLRRRAAQVVAAEVLGQRHGTRKRDRGMGGCNSSWKLVIPACPECHDAGRCRGQFAKAREHVRRFEALEAA